MPFAPCALRTLLVFQAAVASPEDDANRLDQWLQRAGFQGGVLVAKGDPRLDHEAVHGRGDPQARDAGEAAGRG